MDLKAHMTGFADELDVRESAWFWFETAGCTY